MGVHINRVSFLHAVLVIVAANIVQRRKLKLSNGHTVTVGWPSTKKRQITDPRTVEVSGITKAVSRDFLLLYFENEAKSGGGTVEDVQMVSDSTAYVTFESSEGLCLIVISVIFR